MVVSLSMNDGIIDIDAKASEGSHWWYDSVGFVSKVLSVVYALVTPINLDIALVH